MKKPATKAARALLAKLEALFARPGSDGEADAVRVKLERLRGRYDFTAKPPQNLRDLFKGVFVTKTNDANPVSLLDSGALDVASFAKWAIETRCGVPCLFRDGQLWAQTNPRGAKKLATIAATITGGFLALYDQFRKAGGNPADRNAFMAGLWDGMMEETRENQPLPSRTARPAKLAKAGKRSVAPAPGLSIHPYSLAVPLGRQIRFGVPIPEVSAQLDNTIRNQIAA